MDVTDESPPDGVGQSNGDGKCFNNHNGIVQPLLTGKQNNFCLQLRLTIKFKKKRILLKVCDSKTVIPNFQLGTAHFSSRRNT